MVVNVRKYKRRDGTRVVSHKRSNPSVDDLAFKAGDRMPDKKASVKKKGSLKDLVKKKKGIIRIKKAPLVVVEYFMSKFPNDDYNFYYYYHDGIKIYGAEVMRNGKLFDNSIQGSEEWFEHNVYRDKSPNNTYRDKSPEWIIATLEDELLPLKDFLTVRTIDGDFKDVSLKNNISYSDFSNYHPEVSKNYLIWLFDMARDNPREAYFVLLGKRESMFTLQKNGSRLSSIDYGDTTRKFPFNFRKNDYMFFSNKKEAEEHLTAINKRYGNTNLQVVEE